MKIISLNLWGGRIRVQLKDFMLRHQDADIFCFQEIYHHAKQKICTENCTVNLNLFSELQEILFDHDGYFCPVVKGVYGIAIFIKKTIAVVAKHEVTVYHNPDYIGAGPSHDRKIQSITCELNEVRFNVINFHGLWNGKGKNDSPDRLEQARLIKEFLEQTNQPQILCGDFNLSPDTQSMSMLDPLMVNLIKTHGIASTRTAFYPRQIRHADYVLISPDIKLNKFEVLGDEVSDHSPLLLEIFS